MQKSLNLGANSFLVEILETTAAYWEPRIKTYGFKRVTGLSLFKMTMHSVRMTSLGPLLGQMGEEGIAFHLAFCCVLCGKTEFFLLLSCHWEDSVRNHLSQGLSQSPDMITLRVYPADLVFFQGPHFGERYGIAEAAIQALAGRGIRTMATACSGSCIYMVLADGQSEEAVDILAETFEIPKAESGKGPRKI